MEDTWHIALRFFRACHSYTCIGVSVTNAIPAAIAFTIKAVITLGCRAPLVEFLRNSCVRSIRGCEGTSSLMGLWPVRRRGRASSWPSPRANHPAGPPTPYATCEDVYQFSRGRGLLRDSARVIQNLRQRDGRFDERGPGSRQGQPFDFLPDSRLDTPRPRRR